MRLNGWKVKSYPMKNYLANFAFFFLLSTSVLAAPKNTLPPGFSSSPLGQPKIEPLEPEGGAAENSGTGVDEKAGVAPDKTSSALLLLNQTELLPAMTGLLYRSSGLGDDVWLSGDSELTQRLLAEWKVQPNSWPVAELARRLLLTQAQPSAGMDSYDFLLVRLNKLYALGDLDSIHRFFALYPVLAARKEFRLLYQKVVFAQYSNSASGIRNGCALWQASRDKDDNAPAESLALQIEALCLAISGQSGLGLAKAERLSDSDQAPREFFPLLVSALGKEEREGNPPAYSSSDINAILWALYKANNTRPRSVVIKNIDPALLPIMAEDKTLPHGWRLAFTQLSVLRGTVPARKLQFFYEQKNNAANELAPPLKFTRTGTENKVEAQRITNILSTASTRASYMALLYAWGRDIANLPLSLTGTLGGFRGYRSIDGLGASLLFNQNEGLLAWLGTQGDKSQPAAIRAMVAIMQGKSRLKQRGVSRGSLERWQQRMEQLIKITGAEFFDQSESGLPDGDETAEGDKIIDAAEDNLRTEVLLRVLSGLDNPALARDPSFLRAAVKGLKAIGLKKDAWRIMIDSFLIDAWGV